MEEFYKTLRNVGLKDKEIKVYLSLLGEKNLSVNEIAKKTSIPRTTIYSFIETLEEKKLIARSKSSGKSYFSLSNPDGFIDLVKKEHEEVKAKAQATTQLIDLITPYFDQSENPIPRVQIFEGKANVEKMLFEYIHKWRESYARVNSYSLWGYQDSSFVQHYRKWHKYSWSTREKREVIRLFSDEKGVQQQAKDSVTNREIRLLPKGVTFHDTLWIRGEFTLLGMTNKSPHHAVVLHDKRLATNLRSVFQFLWQATS